MKKNKILCIDPAKIISGYSVFTIEDQDIILLDYGLIKTKYKNHLYLLEIYNEIKKLIEKHDINILILEDIYCRNVNTLIVLAMVRSCIMLTSLLYNKDIKIEIYRTKTIRKELCGNGNFNKEQVRKYLIDNYNMDEDIISLDISDSISLGVYYYIIKEKNNGSKIGSRSDKNKSI